jgi:muramoyltetrapeptide carboxypeptidase
MRVAVVATAGPVDQIRLERGCGVLRALGLDPLLGPSVLGGTHDYLAAPDERRAADFTQAWCDPQTEAVICARGGYGSARILPLLDWAGLAVATAAEAAAGRAPKPFVGASDVTALHHALATHLGVRTLYGPMPGGPILGLPEPDPESVGALAAALLHPEWPVELGGGTGLVPGRAEGVTVGGTLALICSLAGTPEFRSAAGGIAVLEDVGEAPYAIDRMLTQLISSGWLTGIRGIACGSWEKCGTPEHVTEVLLDRLGGLGVPVVIGLPFGHGPVQLTVPLGAPAVLDATAGVLRVG